MHKIAIIKTREFSDYHNYDDYSTRKIIESITDWDEVSDEDFNVLTQIGPRLGFVILERPANTPAFIAKTVADYKEMVRAEERRLAAEKKARENAALERKMKKELNDSKTKKALYEKLKSEFEPK
jgi:hypothetical protein